MLNTPPTFAWYIAGLVFQWLKRQGGLDAMGERNRVKAQKLYAAIDGSSFYRNPVAKDARSLDERAVHAGEAGARQGRSSPRRRRRAW